MDIKGQEISHVRVPRGGDEFSKLHVCIVPNYKNTQEPFPTLYQMKPFAISRSFRIFFQLQDQHNVDGTVSQSLLIAISRQIMMN